MRCMAPVSAMDAGVLLRLQGEPQGVWLDAQRVSGGG